jgi:polyisoprenyl-phosphate glycosyltransferase
VSIPNDTRESQVARSAIDKNESTSQLARSAIDKNESTSQVARSAIDKNESTSQVARSAIDKNESTSQVARSAIDKNESTSQVAQCALDQYAPEFSLVIPVYRNHESLPELLKAIETIALALPASMEVVFVIDGSPDQSEAWLSAHLPLWKLPSQLINHARNFGSFAAIRSGLQNARGRYFAVMAADLQEPPELIIDIFLSLRNEPFDVVIGSRSGRDDPQLSQLSSTLFWSAYKRFIMPEMPVGGVDIFGCNQAFLQQLLGMQERNSSLVGLILWLGFRRKEIAYRRRAREHGKSAWTFKKKVNYLLDSTFAFSDLPLKLLMVVGAITMAVALLLGVLALIGRLSGHIQVPGYTMIILAVSFFGAMNVFAIGLVGSYVWRAFENTKARPNAVIRSVEIFEGQAHAN